MSLMSDLSLLASLIFLPFIVFFTIKRRASNKSKLPPSPPRLPIIGNLHQLGSLPHQSLRELANKHGPLMLLKLGQTPTLVASSAEVGQEIMRTYDHIFASRPPLLAPRIILGNDIVFSPYGDHWKQMRKLCVTHLLSTKMVQSFHHVRQEEVAAMISKISESTGAVNMSEVLNSYANSVVCKVLSRKCFVGGRRDVIIELIEGNSPLLGEFSIGDFMPALGWLSKYFGLGPRARKHSSRWHRVLDEIIDEHEEELKETKNQNDLEKRHDFVNVLLALQKDSKDNSEMPITKGDMKSILQDMISAGTDTTFLALDWGMAELIRNPVSMKKLQDEVRSMAGSESLVTEEDASKMSYLKAVIKEVLRLHPPAPLLVPRESMDHCKIQGYDIPNKTRVIVNASAINRDPEHWEEPDKFRPERFLNSDVDFRGQDFQFIPFGAGRRICPGMQFAVTNLQFAFANLMHKFDWMLPDGKRGEDLDMSDSPGLTNHRKERLHLLAKPFIVGR